MTADPPPVVTLFGTFGAGTEAIGQRVAELLDVALHAQAFSSAELQEAREEPERATPTLGRVLAALPGSTVFALGYGTNPGPDVAHAQRDLHELVTENTRIVEEEAAQGGVIVGRNGAFILAERPNTLHVRLDAPRDDRVARAAREADITHERAAELQRREDAVRAEMSRTFYGWDPRELDSYDLVLNTAARDDETCAAIITAAYHATASGPASPA